MATSANYVIIGGGLAAAMAAQAIRERDSSGSVIIVCREKYLPYDRPPLSKDMLRDDKGEMSADDIASVNEKFYPDKNVQAIIGTHAKTIDRAAKTVTLENSNSIAYDKLLIATGSEPRSVDVPEGQQDNILYLRTYDDSVKLRDALNSSKSAALIGAGYIGLEVAAACAEKKIQATIVEPSDQPWARFASKVLGGFLTKHFERQGIKFLFGDSATAVEKSGENFAVRTKNGQVFSADCVVAGVGIEYNTQIAADCGLTLDQRKRIRVDSTLQTNDPSIWAAGDITVYPDELLGKDFSAEHYMNAKWQGEAAGKNMSGPSVPFKQIPYFFSDMGDLHMILRGDSEDRENTTIFGDLMAGEFVELYANSANVLKMGIAFSRDEKKLDAISNRLESLIKDKALVTGIGEDVFAE